MQEPTTATVSLTSSSSSDVMSEILRQGAQRMLATAIESEVSDWTDVDGGPKLRRGAAESYSAGWGRVSVVNRVSRVK